MCGFSFYIFVLKNKAVLVWMFVFSSLKAVLLCFYRPLLVVVIAMLLCSRIRFSFLQDLFLVSSYTKYIAFFFVVVICISALH